MSKTQERAVPLACVVIAFLIGWYGREAYEFREVQVEIPAEAPVLQQEIIYPDLPEGAINDLRRN